jgi:hypothetical protein
VLFRSDPYTIVAADTDNLGVTTAKLEWLPIGGLLGTDEQDYYFVMTAVARYNVVYKNGPTGIRALGKISILTAKPGKDGAAAADQAGAPYSLDNNALIGGIGTDIDLDGNGYGALITISDKNILVYNDGAGVTTKTDDLTKEISVVESKVYTIEVYPAVNVQVAEARKAIQKEDPRAWDTNSVPGAKLASRYGESDTTTAKASKLYYYGGTAAPTYNLTTKFGSNGYNKDAAYWDIDSDTGVVSLAPVGYDDSVAEDAAVITQADLDTFYTFSPVAVAQFKLDFSQGASGDAEITAPTGLYAFTSANRTVRDKITIGSGAPSEEGYVELGSTSLKATGSFNDVSVRQGSSMLGTFITTNGGTTTFNTTNASEHIIRFFKEQP